jgi:hypothetical protein
MQAERQKPQGRSAYGGSTTNRPKPISMNCFSRAETCAQVTFDTCEKALPSDDEVFFC